MWWKKRTKKTPTMKDACVSTEDAQICVAANVSMDLTVVCSSHEQRQTRMDSGAAVQVKYERELELKNQRIRELEEEQAVSKRLTADLMLHMNVEEQVRKYAEKSVISWCDECERKKQVPAVTDLAGKFIITDRDAKNPEPEATSGRNTECDCGTEEKQCQVQKMRDMCDELTWYKEQLLASMCREELMGNYIRYCCLKSDQLLVSEL